MFMSKIKERLKAGECVYGLFINSGSTIACEIAGLAGYDFVMIDSEHGPTDVIDNRELIMAAEYRSVMALMNYSRMIFFTIIRSDMHLIKREYILTV